MSGFEDSASLSIGAAGGSRAAEVAALLGRILRSSAWPICVITAVAAALRLADIDRVGGNLFYDAAVRSMALSWHNFFFGAFDPGAILSVDKPPIDLWLQVACVKLFGWNTLALRLPEVLGGTLSVPLLYDVVRRVVSRPAGLAAAVALAIAPESVLTSRSDTMDSLMMLLVLCALWLIVRACERGTRRHVVLAGVALGLAFNVKLFEALVPAPALFLLYLLGSPVPWPRRVLDVLLGAVALVAVGLSWAVAVSLAPGHHPIPVGSTDGTVWNVIFVFNGFGRIGAATAHGLGGPGVLRLVAASAWHFDVLAGCILVPALVLAAGGLIATILRRRKYPRGAPQPLARAFAISIAVWIAVAVWVFSSVGTLHTRYLEALAPALAVAIGYGAAALAGLHRRGQDTGVPPLYLIGLALACICAYAFALGSRSIAGAALALAVSTIGAAVLARDRGRLRGVARWLIVGLLVATAALFPVRESLSLVRTNSNDSLGLAVTNQRTSRLLWTYLEPRTAGLRYELAVDEPLAQAPLIIHDQRPILPLTSFQGRLAVGLSRLRAAVRSGQVRYGLVGSYGCKPRHRKWAGCGPAALWIRRTGLDVSSAAGLQHSGSRLYLLLAS